MKDAFIELIYIIVAIEAASSMKKGGISIPVKQRSFAKKMDDIGKSNSIIS